MAKNKSLVEVSTSNAEVLGISKTSIKLKVRAAIHKHTYDYKLLQQPEEYVVVRVFDRSLIHNIYMALKRQGIAAKYKKGIHSGAWFMRVVL